MSRKGGLTLYHHLSKAPVQLGLEVKDREDLLFALAREAQASGLVSDHRTFLDHLKAREAEMSTGVGRGLAVPHAEVSGAGSTFVIGATLKQPIEYHSLDNQPVDVVFLIGGKPGEVGLHLQILARIARIARQAKWLEQLRGERTAEGFLGVVEQAEKELYFCD